MNTAAQINNHMTADIQPLRNKERRANHYEDIYASLCKAEGNEFDCQLSDAVQGWSLHKSRLIKAALDSGDHAEFGRLIAGELDTQRHIMAEAQIQ